MAPVSTQAVAPSGTDALANQPGSAVAPPISPTVAPTTPAPDMSNLPGPAGTPEQAIIEGNMQGASEHFANAAKTAETPIPQGPHARLVMMIQGLSAAVAGSGAQWASRGKVNGAEVTNQILAQEAQQRENQQKLAMEQKNQDIQHQITIGQSNAAVANMMSNLMATKQEMSARDLQMKSEKIGQIGATQDVRTKALQDYMQTGDLKAYQDTLSQLGNVTAPAGGAPAGAAAPTGSTNAATGAATGGASSATPAATGAALPPVAIGSWQNGLDAASLAYPNDPDIKQAAADFKTAQEQAATDPQAASLAMARAARIAQNRMSALDTGVKSRTAQEAADVVAKFETPQFLAAPGSTAAIKAKIADPATSPEDKLRLQSLVADSIAAQNQALVQKQREDQAAQIVAQGDPAIAGKLLADRTLTVDELKLRNATPQFMESAVNAAKKLDPTFKAPEAAAQGAIARSASNQQFFGNTDSLLVRGGTLDQLEAAGTALGNAQIPAFNTLNNLRKVALGQGPQAAYAAAVLGVADDYSKVMTGGQGSDTSRQQAVDIIDKNLSPEGRTAAVAQIRRQVQSQRNGRIGQNPYMRDMYPDPATMQETPGVAGTQSAKPVYTRPTTVSTQAILMQAPGGQPHWIEPKNIAAATAAGATEVK